VRTTDKRGAQKIIRILLECDGGSEYWAAEQVRQFCNDLPDYSQEARAASLEKFGKELDRLSPSIHKFDDEFIHSGLSAEQVPKGHHWCKNLTI